MTDPNPWGELTWQAIINNLPADDAALVKQATSLQRFDFEPERDHVVIQLAVSVDGMPSMSERLPLLKETGREMLGFVPTFVLQLEKVSR